MLSSTRLDGIALVVGGASGIGQQAVYSLAEAGAEVIVLADLNEEGAIATAEESKQYASNKNYRTATFKVDVTDAEQVHGMVDFVVREFGRLDYCVNSAGVDNGIHAPVADTDIDNFSKVQDVNSKGLMLCVRAEAAAMRKQEPRTFRGRSGERDIGRGAIVNMASANSFAGLPGKMSYTVSKHAALALTKMAGMDHASEGIRCNAVCPTWVQTPLLDVEFQKNPQSYAEMSAVVPIERAAKCEEVSDAIAFLCSPAASYINGTSLVIDCAVTTTIRLH
ncbi:Glucose/ribitol dehydrogenase [Penicillium occitanis (nom. inval.)]|nr:Glucose/ribitol dehydrogenase [Penicillium occitanis (nom. inval.)]PCG97509.1 hypothetical protein PENOC_067480 [Penicillium occitanis (nom. inval.)]